MKKIKIPNNSKVIHKMFDHLIPYDIIEVPVEHRQKKENPHSLRCFKHIYEKDKEGNKLKDLPKRRCRNKVVKGYLFCKYHGGKENTLTLHKNGELCKSETAKIYKDVFNPDLGDLMVTFLNDPNMLDLKPELAGLRTILNNYIKILTEEPKATTINGVNSFIQDTLYDEELTGPEKYREIIDCVMKQQTLTNGNAIDRIIKCVDMVGKTIERINKLEVKSDYMLTPDGLKVILRTVVNLIKRNITNEDILEQIKDGMLKMSVETKGDLSKYKNKEAMIDAEIVK